MASTARAWESGAYEDEVIVVGYRDPEGHEQRLTRDTGPRESTMDSLAKLKPSFRTDGRDHVGNASQMS